MNIRRTLPAAFIGFVFSAWLVAFPAAAESDPLPSWNDGPVKQEIIEFTQ